MKTSVGKDPGASRKGLRDIDHLKAYVNIDGSVSLDPGLRDPERP